MKLALFEDGLFEQFYPITYMRPVFDLRCGTTTLREKIERIAGRKTDVVFVRDWLSDCYKAKHSISANDVAKLKGDDALIVNGRLLCLSDMKFETGRDVCAMSGGKVAYIALTKQTASKIQANDFAAFLDAAAKAAKVEEKKLRIVEYPWHLIEENANAIRDDFKSLGRKGIQGILAPLSAVWGPEDQVYIAPGAVVEPCAVLDTNEGPVIIEEGARINPHTRIQGPASIGKGTIVLGGKIREGTTIGPVCRVGGEVEEAIMHGHSNKYHDGFLGHAYVCEWVNLGALTTNSDLKNDYSTVDVKVRGKLMDTGSTKVGCFIGDHTKTSIGTVINTGTMVGMMSNILGVGQLLPKSMPSFAMFMDGKFFKAGLKQLTETAKTAMGRRKVQMLPQEEELLKFLFELTKAERDELTKKSRREMMLQKGLKS